MPWFLFLLSEAIFAFGEPFPLFSSFDFTPPQSTSLIGQLLLGITVGEAWSEWVDTILNPV
ncbi:MAG: hypothetical protein QNJ18_17950 [Xenococcaceae cyanobacterium MO_167.B52]|nr:hypothetical protein [Xenococcaceae cyanobacterium MO_167.B52]